MTTAPDAPDGAIRRNRLAAVVLAAGRSTRAGGHHKVLGRIDGRTIVRLAGEAALASGAVGRVGGRGHAGLLARPDPQPRRCFKW